MPCVIERNLWQHARRRLDEKRRVQDELSKFAPQRYCTDVSSAGGCQELEDAHVGASVPCDGLDANMRGPGVHVRSLPLSRCVTRRGVPGRTSRGQWPGSIEGYFVYSADWCRNLLLR